MTPRPLYRWKSFWFGILVLGFLGWAWGSALDQTSTLVIRKGGYAYSAGAGTLGVYIVETGFFEAGIFRGNPGSSPLFPPFVEKKTEVWWTGFLVAYWFLILLFLVPWSGWLAWRWRKIKRLSKPGTQ